jgi:filamentous hemagglutinin family protein
MCQRFFATLNERKNHLKKRQKRQLPISQTISFRPLMIAGSVFSFGLFASSSVRAQIVTDGTVETEVNNSDNVSEITGGTRAGNNLFHSFQEFSVGQSSTAFFNNAADIGNIISRVTGGSISNIDGLIRANGNANLILINPAGINFGADARLDIGGSFLSSTAESLVFEDGTIFSARNPEAAPLLTVTVPVGLQLGQNSGAINVKDTGHNLTLAVPIFSPFTRGEVSGLEVKPGQTLGLVGGNISLIGGILTAEDGHIELGSVGEGTVGLNLADQGFTLDYQNISAFKDLSLSQKSLIDASGINGGSIQVQGEDVSVSDGSVVLIQNLGEGTSGNISINTSESLNLTGTTVGAENSSGLVTEALSGGEGGKINIATQQLVVEAGANIIADTFSKASGGNITIDAAELVRIDGFSDINPNRFSVVSGQTFGTGNAGNITISTKKLTALDGGNVSSVTAGTKGIGSGGDITVNALESVELIGVNLATFAPSQITAGSGSPGDAGNVSVNTERLVVKDGGRVDASSTAIGNAGNLTINAGESVQVSGNVPGSINPSLIIASANILDPALRELFGLPPAPSGNSGNITIETPQLQVTDGGQVTVRNDGVGNAGNLNINADSISLDTQGGITAATQEGSGGRINLQVADSLKLNRGSQISSDNFGGGSGGEISIKTNTLNIRDRSFLTTTAFGSGSGGNITVDAADSVEIVGTGFTQFQQTFQRNALAGTLEPGTRGTGIFIGTAKTGQAGDLKIDTGLLSLRDGAAIFGPIFTDGIGGNITVDATDSIEIIGSALQIDAGIGSSAKASAGNIRVNTEKLSLRDGGTIINATFGNAAGGDIEISAAEFIELNNTPPGSFLFTGIYANTSVGQGPGGDIKLKTERLDIKDGFITSNTGSFVRDGLVISGGGKGGNIAIEVGDKLEIMAFPSNSRFVSGISSSSYSNAPAGNIEIFTDKLLVQDGSEISSAALSSGDGGKLTINAKESIELIGTSTVQGIKRGGLLAASGRASFPELVATGASGNVAITTGDLTIKDGASIDVQSLGSGDTGELEIVADSIVLDNEGIISAASTSGVGGNITLEADNIFWRGNSTTTARSEGTGDGGNINIQADNLVFLENSDLTADANAGRGGNIEINTQGLFKCGECQISASSQLGVDGIVNINVLEPNTNLEIVDIPEQPAQPEETVALACSGSQNPKTSTLTITGRGGLPARPNEALSSESLVSFARTDVRAEQSADNMINSNVADSRRKLPSPAQSWYINNQGVVVLTAELLSTDGNGNASRFNYPNCHVR